MESVGILAPARLDRWLQVVLVVLLVTCAARYLMRHPFDVTAVLILLGAVALGLAYSTRHLVADRPPWPTVWVVVVVTIVRFLPWRRRYDRRVDARAILAERYARGEIDAEEYAARRDVLSQ